MQKQTPSEATKTVYPILRQIVNLIPPNVFHAAASARTVAELYRARWAVELFFKELKQTCQLRDFVGYSENAVKWQIWTGLLVHLLLRYLKFLSKWKLSFSRLAGVVRAGVWVRRSIVRLLEM